MNLTDLGLSGIHLPLTQGYWVDPAIPFIEEEKTYKTDKVSAKF